MDKKEYEESLKKIKKNFETMEKCDKILNKIVKLQEFENMLEEKGE